MRWAVIGDVGGHLGPLSEELGRLGVDVEAGIIPEDLTIVQLGDLVHRGPDSAGVLRLVDLLMQQNPGRWIQLVGNHEAQYLRRPAFKWKDKLDSGSADLVRRWWRDGRMQVAAVVPTPRGDVLVTHAGLTEGLWREDLGSPPTAEETAAILNHPLVRDADGMFRPGVMLTGQVNHRAGPIWAEAGQELVASWLDHEMPFGQVHGHSSLIDWTSGAWRAGEDIVGRTLLDLLCAHEMTVMSGGLIVGVDPGHGAEPQPRWRAWQPLPADHHEDPAVA